MVGFGIVHWLFAWSANHVQLFNDTQTFCSEIKKAALKIVPSQYNLFPPSSAKTQAERIQAVKDKAAALLENSQYLQGEPDALVHIF